MGTLSETYDIIETDIGDIPHPSVESKVIDSITDKLSPHWCADSTHLAGSNIDEANDALKKYISEINDLLKDVYGAIKKDYDGNLVIMVNGESTQFDKRFDDIIIELRNIYGDEGKGFFGNVKENQKMIETKAQDYLDENTESCTRIVFAVPITYDDGTTGTIIKHKHQCTKYTHGPNEHEEGSCACPYHS